MKIDHIAIYVHDLDSMKAFYIKYFDAEANDGYFNPKTGLRTYFLRFSDGSRLELMNRPGMVNAQEEPYYAGLTHFAFSVGSREGVLHLTQRLRDAGCEVASEARTTGDGYFESCVLDPEKNRIEITV